MWNLIIGIVLIVLGATGRVSLIFTDSPALLMAVGALIAAYGGWQIYRSSR